MAPPETAEEGAEADAAASLEGPRRRATAAAEGEGCCASAEPSSVPTSTPVAASPPASPPPLPQRGQSAEEVYRDALNFDRLRRSTVLPQPPHLSATGTAARVPEASAVAASPSSPPSPGRRPNFRRPWYPSAERVAAVPDPTVNALEVEDAGKEEEDEEEEKREILSDAEEFVLASEALGWEGTGYDDAVPIAAAHASATVSGEDDEVDDDDRHMAALKRQAYDPWHTPRTASATSASASGSAMRAMAVPVASADPPPPSPAAFGAVRLASAGRAVSSGSAVHAEWVGIDLTAGDNLPAHCDYDYDYGRTTAADTTSSAGDAVVSIASSSYAATGSTPTATTAEAATFASASSEGEDGATEVAVLDHAPWRYYDEYVQNLGSGGELGNGDDTSALPAWKCTGEAQVLEDTGVAAAELDDGKPPAIGSATVAERPARPHAEAETTGFVEAHPEAEVLGIQHDAHPLELQDDGGAHAELVGVVGDGADEVTAAEAADAVAVAAAESFGALAAGVAVAQVATAAAAAPVEGTPTAAAVAVSARVVECDVEQTPTASNVTVLRSGFATAPPLPPRNPFGRLSNPFEDDPNDTPALSRDAIAQLDAQADRSWMTVPTVVTSDTNVEPATPVAATLPMTSESTESTPLPRPLKTVESEMPPRNWDDEDDEQEGYYRPHRSGEVPDWLRDDSARDLPTRPPPPRPFGGSEPRSTSRMSGFSDGSQRSAFGGPPAVSCGGPAGGGGGMYMMSQVMETLFGDPKPSFLMGRSVSTGSVGAGHILTRVLLPWSVIYNPTKKMWVATLQTNQSALDSNDVAAASKSLRAFSLPTEKRAVCLAQAWTPPRMMPFSESPTCHICDSRFAVFRRACHCRNCGVCICRTRECAVQWPSKMIPETYNLKREAYVNICKSCDWLCNSFRLSLLEGDFDQVVAIHSTGNVNVNSPFANIKGELLYPVHCAVLGGNLDLLRWLVDEHCCPIKSVRVSGKMSHNAGTYTPIVTSKGRSLLGIAMETGNVPIMRYLVVEKGISVAGEKDITTAMLIQSFTACLYRLPASGLQDSPRTRNPMREDSGASVEGASTPYEDDGSALGTSNGRSLSDEARDLGAIYKHREEYNGEDDLSDYADVCIICYDNKIDCVSNPCGHQIMCMACAENVSRCPVCASDCTFIRVYKP